MQQQHKPHLLRGLNARHIRFIALGSAIGTGLFYGSASAIKAAGPAVLLVSGVVTCVHGNLLMTNRLVMYQKRLPLPQGPVSRSSGIP